MFGKIFSKKSFFGQKFIFIEKNTWWIKFFGKSKLWDGNKVWVKFFSSFFVLFVKKSLNILFCVIN